MQNIVLISVILVAVLISVELTRWTLNSKKRVCPPATLHHTTASSPPTESSTGTVAQIPSSLSSSDPMGSLPVGQPWTGSDRFLALAGAGVSPVVSPIPPIFNQITHGLPDEWTYCGYASPASSAKPGKAVRYPLYVRRNLYQKNGYDYYVVDDSRNRVRINIELPRGVYQLWSGDEINIDGEVGKWVVTIDIPPDSTWSRGFPFAARF